MRPYVSVSDYVLMNNQSLINIAKQIADLIEKTDIDDRGILFSHVATLLRSNGLHRMPALIYQLAVEYGIPENADVNSADVPETNFGDASGAVLGAEVN
jgi:hypothetical protein